MIQSIADRANLSTPPFPEGDRDDRLSDRDWFLSNPDLFRSFSDRVVAVHDRTVLGSGADFGIAYLAAKEYCAAHHRVCPAPVDISFVVVPLLLDSDPTPPEWETD